MINRKHKLHLKDYHELHKYSVTDYMFWEDLWQFLAIIYSVPPSCIISPGNLPHRPLWFPAARLNYAENLLHRRDDAIAVTSADELGRVSHTSFRQLRMLVGEMAAALKGSGVTAGDRIAAIVANSLTAVVIALATASVGAIFSSTATDMGPQGILDRYTQIRPRVIFAETEIVYAGKANNQLPKVREVVRGLNGKGLERVVLLPSIKTLKEVDIVGVDIANSVNLTTFLASGDGRELVFEQLPFDHPLFILYSSGTSGPPKCIVHSAGGVLMQTKKDMVVGFNIGPDDTYFHYTSTGWMVWPFMLGTLSCGARIVTYDGTPFYPDMQSFLRFVGEQGVSVFGTSPRFLVELQGQGIRPLKLAPFDSLRSLIVTGAVLTPPVMEWAQEAFGNNTHIVSTSGGTDICASFVTGIPCLPLYAGEIQGKALGMKVEVFDTSGNNIEHTGLPGELVCTRPHISLPVAFWGDESGEKFRKAYFDHFPGVWRQGDFVVANPKTKGIMVLGRSDGVLNPSGVRFGSGEIYTVLEQFSSVLDDSLCVGQRRPQDTDERVLLFVKMRPGQKFTKELEGKIRAAIRKALSARHVPAFVLEVTDIPYTVNGKKIEIAVKHIVSGSDLKPSGTVANPESLQLYYRYRDIESFIDKQQGAKL
jgi:acetoacetyl-CoA synthetase